MITQKETILHHVKVLVDAYHSGKIRAESMPEDARPELPKDSRELVHYLTFPMSLNYQRNSYTLWEAALKLYNDPEKNYVFDPEQVTKKDFLEIQRDLIAYKVALQPNKHVATWIALSTTFHQLYQNDVRNLFEESGYDIQAILTTMQITRKKKFPYLSGHKIANYWLYVLTQYTSLPFKNLEALTIAPDTHVIQASMKLGLIEEKLEPQVVAQIWKDLLEGSGLTPIEIHTPLWLWSRSGFAFEV